MWDIRHPLSAIYIYIFYISEWQCTCMNLRDILLYIRIKTSMRVNDRYENNLTYWDLDNIYWYILISPYLDI